jgi:transposase
MSTHRFVLTPSDIKALEQALQDARLEVRRKAKALLLWNEGTALREIAAQAGVRSLQTIYNWIEAYRTGGIDGLARRSSKGRPRLATPAYKEILEVVTASTPREQGIDLDGWTAEALNRTLETLTGISISDARFRVLLHDLGYRFMLVRPAPASGLPAPRTWAEIQAQLDTLLAGAAAGKKTYTWSKQKLRA